MRKCTKCGEEKAWTEFYKDVGGKNGHSARCKACTDANKQKWLNAPGNKLRAKENAASRYSQDRTRRRLAALCKKYGVEAGWYEATLAQQNGRCAICKTEHPGRGDGRRRMFSVDHDHRTGAVRGLLCISCNMALGGFQDAPELLVKAIQYLGEHDGNSKTECQANVDHTKLASGN